MSDGVTLKGRERELASPDEPQPTVVHLSRFFDDNGKVSSLASWAATPAAWPFGRGDA